MTNPKPPRASVKGAGLPASGKSDAQRRRVQALFRNALHALERRQLSDAADLFYQVLQIDPGHGDSCRQLGVLAHRAGRFDTAKRFFVQALRLDPDAALGHVNLGLTLIALGETADAEAAFRHAIACDPAIPEAHLALATLLHRSARRIDAMRALKRALDLKPDYAAAHLNLGNVLREEGQLTEAASSARQAVALQPDSTLAWRALGVILQEQGLIPAALEAFDRALALAPDFREAQSNRLFCLNYDPSRSALSIANAHRLWGDQILTSPRPEPPSPRDHARLRIGYVSADLHRHPVGFFLSGVVASHDKSKVEVFCYANGDGEDDLTHRLRQASDHWRTIKDLSDATVEGMVRADEIDILIDLSGHTTSNRLSLFHRRPAPVQVSWLGYVSTTGAPAIDYLITDVETAPEGSENLYSETLIRLPHVRFCYAPPDYAPEPVAAPSSLGQPFTFASFNDLMKLGPLVIEAWSAVLKGSPPDARLLLKWKALDDEGVRDRLLNAFSAQGVDAKRLVLRGHSPHGAMLKEYWEADLALDPFPFGGGLTTCEALWMGVPVVTLPLDRPASRQSLSFLKAIGVEGLVADTVPDYVALACGLAHDPARLSQLRRGLRARMEASVLCQPQRFTPTLEAAFLTMTPPR